MNREIRSKSRVPQNASRIYIPYVKKSGRRNRRFIGALYEFRLTADERTIDTAIDREEIVSVVASRKWCGKTEGLHFRRVSHLWRAKKFAGNNCRWPFAIESLRNIRRRPAWRANKLWNPPCGSTVRANPKKGSPRPNSQSH